MAVPMLNFAQMPLVQPRSEMTDFSNALLQAGQMRQQRLKEQQARNDMLAQRELENSMNQQRLGMEQQRLGLAQNEDVRAGQRLQSDLKSAELGQQATSLNIQAAEREAADRAKEDAFQQILAQPQHAQMLQQLQQSGDDIGVLNYVDDLARQNGVDLPKSFLETSQARSRLLSEQAARATDSVQRQLIQAKIRTEGIEQQKLKLQMSAPAGALDPTTVKELVNNVEKHETDLNSMIAQKSRIYDSLAIMGTKTPSIEDLKALEQQLPQDDPAMAELKKFMIGYGKMKDPNQQKLELQNFATRISGSAQNYRKQILELEDARNRTTAQKADLVRLQSRGLVNLPVIPSSFGQQTNPQLGLNPQQATPSPLAGLLQAGNQFVRNMNYGARNSIGMAPGNTESVDRAIAISQEAMNTPVGAPPAPPTPPAPQVNPAISRYTYGGPRAGGSQSNDWFYLVPPTPTPWYNGGVNSPTTLSRPSKASR